MEFEDAQALLMQFCTWLNDAEDPTWSICQMTPEEHGALTPAELPDVVANFLLNEWGENPTPTWEDCPHRSGVYVENYTQYCAMCAKTIA